MKGLPIIDEKIKGIIAEIQENAKALCGETKNTTFRDAGIELNRIGQDFSQIRDPIGLEKSVNYMQIVLSAICAKMPEKESGLFDFMNKSAIAATLSGFGTFVFSEIFDIFPPNYNKHVISVVLAIIIFAIILIFTRTYYNGKRDLKSLWANEKRR